MSPWYVIRTATRRESRALASLQELGLEAYCPMMIRWGRLGRQQCRERREQPLFPGYAFARIAKGQFASVEACDGVSSVLRSVAPSGELRPHAVAESVVTILKAAEADGAFDLTQEQDAPFKVGDRVRITEGPFAGMVGEVRKLRPRERVRVLLDAVRGAALKPIEFRNVQIENAA